MRFLTKAIVHTQPESDETGEIIEKLNIVNPVENVLNTSDLEPELCRKSDHYIDDINEIEDLNCYDDDDNIDNNEYIDDDDEQVSMLPPSFPARTGDLRYVFYRRSHNDDKYKYLKLVLQFVITMILIIFFFWLFNMAKLNKSHNRSNITNNNNNTFDNDSNHN